jgi:DNA-binding transcriptional LysR family regulator
MQWDHLRIVLAIHRGGSMQAAAESLRMDRSTVLRRLDSIEADLGERLFVRGSEGCIPTSRGDEVAGTAKSIEAAMSSLGQRVKAKQTEVKGVVTVSVPSFVAARILAPAMPRFVAQHPGIELRVLATNQHVNIASGEADIGLRNRWPEQESLIARKAAEVAYGFYASRDYLAKRGVPDGSFAGHDLLLLDESLATMLGYDRMRELAATGQIVMRSTDILALVVAAEAGTGIAFIPSLATNGSTSLTGVWPGVCGGLRDVFLVAHQEMRDQKHIRSVYDFLIALCGECADVFAGRSAIAYVPESGQ